MAITFADKNRFAPVGTEEARLSADNINEIKREVNSLGEHASIYVADGDEVETTIGVGDGDAGNPKKISGNFSLNLINGFSYSADGRITKTSEGSSVFHIDVSMLIGVTVGINKTVAIYIYKNGSRNQMSYKKLDVDSTRDVDITMLTSVTLGKGDYVEIYVENQTDTSSIRAAEIMFRVS